MLPLAFDATSVDVLSLRFGPRQELIGNGGGATESHNQLHIEDALEGDGTTRGGDPDAVTHYSVIQNGLSLGDQEACVLGRASAGAAGERVGFFGCDAVTMKEAAHTAR